MGSLLKRFFYSDDFSALVFLFFMWDFELVVGLLIVISSVVTFHIMDTMTPVVVSIEDFDSSIL